MTCLPVILRAPARRPGVTPPREVLGIIMETPFDMAIAVNEFPDGWKRVNAVRLAKDPHDQTEGHAGRDVAYPKPNIPMTQRLSTLPPSPDLIDRPFHMLRAALPAGQHDLLGLPQRARAQVNRLVQG